MRIRKEELFMKKLKKIGKFFGGIVCIVVGLAISGFGITQLLPKKQYGGGEVEVPTVSSKAPDEE
jgi:hypothetical protein